MLNFLPPRWRKVGRDLWDNKSRTLLVVVSIAIGVFAFGGLFIATDIGIVDMITQYRATSPANIILHTGGFDDDVLTWARRQDRVTQTQGRTVYSARLLTGGTTYSLTLYAFDDYNHILLNQIAPQAGSWPPRKGEVLLERNSLTRAKLQIGQPATIQLDNGKKYDLNLAGTVHDLHVFPANLRPNLTAYISLDTLEMLNLSRRFNELDIAVDPSLAEPMTINGASGINPDLIVKADDIQKELKRRGIKVGSMEVLHAESHWAVDIIRGLSIILVGMGLFSLLLSGFLVVNIISSLVAQQKRQIGMMKVVGATGQQVTGVYVAIVTLYGVLALVIALPGALALAYVLIAYIAIAYLNFDMTSFYQPVRVLLLEIAVGLLCPLLAALVPILSGTRLTAAQAISDYVVRRRTDVVSFALSKVRGLPTPMMLSLRNTFRHQGRLLMTLSTLVLAGTLFISVLNVQNSLRQELRNLQEMSDFDVQISLEKQYDRAAVERRALQIPGVIGAEGWAGGAAQRYRPNRERGASFTVYGLPPDSMFVLPTMKEGRWLNTDDRYNIVISSDLLDNEPDLRVGGVIRLEMNDKQRDWTIVGILLSSQSVAYAPYRYFTDFQGSTDLTSNLLLRTTQHDGPFQDAIARQLKVRMDDADIKYLKTSTQDEILSGMNANFDILINILLAMAVLVATVGGLGLTGMMSLNVLERTREIGVMRAVGASDGAVRVGVLFEGTLVGLLSWVVSIPLSYPTSRFFDDVLGHTLFQRSLPFTSAITGPLIWLAIISVISTGASLMPARRASKISVREALAYE
jgi:putative ABC transport system permease protein